MEQALGKRVAKEISAGPGQDKKTLSYLYLSDQDRILIGKSPDGGQTLYLDGEGIDQHLGEVSARRALGYATDHLGSVLNSPIAGPDHAYGPYGEALGDTDRAARLDSEPVIYGFTGRQFDPESRLYYYRARMYDPDIGRFLSRDPMGLRGGMNPYEYAGNNPPIYFDPYGLCNLIAGIGGNATNVAGMEGSWFAAINPGWFGQAQNANVFISGGPTLGYSLSGGLFFGAIFGDFNSVSSPFINVNLNFAVFGVTLFFDPSSNSFAGFDISLGPGIGDSVSYTNTTVAPPELGGSTSSGDASAPTIGAPPLDAFAIDVAPTSIDDSGSTYGPAF